MFSRRDCESVGIERMPPRMHQNARVSRNLSCNDRLYDAELPKSYCSRLGANLTGTSGSLLIITPNAPPGPLLEVLSAVRRNRIAKGWTGKAYWGYYGYHEDGGAVPQDLFAPRNFQANL